MTTTTTYDEGQRDEIAAVLVGHRIVQADMGPLDDAPVLRYGDRPEGRLVLDDGTVLYLLGNEGGCCCGAGDYPLAKVAAFDNVITSAAVEANPDGDDEDGDGTYRIFVFADAVSMNVAEFVGSDGNGYYGTGFSVTVVPGPAALASQEG
jgi:hypothetical protein